VEINVGVREEYCFRTEIVDEMGQYVLT